MAIDDDKLTREIKWLRSEILKAWVRICKLERREEERGNQKSDDRNK